jgi:hypothetical protein
MFLMDLLCGHNASDVTLSIKQGFIVPEHLVVLPCLLKDLLELTLRVVGVTAGFMRGLTRRLPTRL